MKFFKLIALYFVSVIAVPVAFGLLTGLAKGAEPAPQFVVENKCPAFTVVNRMPVVPVVPPLTIPAKAADWHTHTCRNGHTWAHASSDPNASHNCPVCGSYQNVIDQGSIGGGSVAAPVQTYTLPQASGEGCAGGNCPLQSQSYSRPGLFGRRR